ncbi:hypothetical protein ILYODFUR_037030 [Ilyodon furcidens]|uniref:Uncharacterized protein n=1 Tax=Ilyodon furcidens TaxID=33524 RepID=A0ABV0V188_9TELE
MGPHCCSYAAPNLLDHLRKEIVKLNTAGEKCLPTFTTSLALSCSVFERYDHVHCNRTRPLGPRVQERVFCKHFAVPVSPHSYFLTSRGAEANTDHLSHPPRMIHTCFQEVLSISGYKANYLSIFG